MPRGSSGRRIATDARKCPEHVATEFPSVVRSADLCDADAEMALERHVGRSRGPGRRSTAGRGEENDETKANGRVQGAFAGGEAAVASPHARAVRVRLHLFHRLNDRRTWSRRDASVLLRPDRVNAE